MHREQEFWVEHQVQHAKSTTSHRGSNNPEIVIANQLALEQAISVAKVAGTEDGSPLKSIGDLMPSSRHGKSMRGSHLDQGDCIGHQLLGSGNELACDSEDKQAALAALGYIFQCHREEAQELGWSEQHIDGEHQLFHYGHADRAGCEIIKSRNYGRETKRHSHWALVRYEGEGELYVADIQFFCLANPSTQAATSTASPPSPPDDALRFAVCHLYAATEIHSCAGVIYKADTKRSPQYKNYGVLMPALLPKLIVNHEQSSASSYFAHYMNFQYSKEP